MTKTQDEIHQEELQAISKEIIESQAKSGQPFQAFDPELELARRKRREEKLARLEKESKEKESKKSKK